MANDDDLPTDFDVVVLGTGMPESILAAAAARVGQTVLHIDRNEYYGGKWASFNFDQLLEWITKQKTSDTLAVDDCAELLLEEEQLMRNANQKTIFNLSVNQYICDKKEESNDNDDSKSLVSVTSVAQEAEEKDECSVETPENKDNVKAPRDNASSEAPTNSEENGVENGASSTEKETPLEKAGSSTADVVEKTPLSVSKPKERKKWSLEELSTLRRKFNIDLSPKLLFSRGSLVELLITSNISRYAEFKSATRVLTFIGDGLVQVPCSRADVFSTKHVTVVEKRMLMKFIAFCLDFQKQPEEYRGFEGRPFKDFVKSKKLTPNIEHYVIHAIAMVDPETPTLQSLTRIQKFLESLGRYGNSPFLWPIYGSAELPQCFCRLCAVFGGIYYLNRSVDGMVVDLEGKCTAIVTQGKRINCKWLIMESGFAPLEYLPDNINDRISKGIFITDKSIMPVEREQLTLLRLPPDENIRNPVTILEVGSSACVCPPGLNIVYASCISWSESAEQDMQPVTDKLLHNNSATSESNKPNLLWSLCFNQLDMSGSELSQKCPPNTFIVPSPDIEQDYDIAIEQAKIIFGKINPEAEFLPRAPDPEEIILESDEPNPSHNSTEQAAEALEEETNPSPDGASSSPDGASPSPDGANSSPDGANSSPDGASPSPDGASPSPEGASPSPDGASPSPEGASPSPEGASPSPEGANSSPVQIHSATIDPNGTSSSVEAETKTQEH